MFVDGSVTAQIRLEIEVERFDRQHRMPVLVGLALSKILPVLEEELLAVKNVDGIHGGCRVADEKGLIFWRLSLDPKESFSGSNQHIARAIW
jgi:hypothetical protein